MLEPAALPILAPATHSDVPQIVGHNASSRCLPAQLFRRSTAAPVLLVKRTLTPSVQAVPAHAFPPLSHMRTHTCA